MLGEEACRRIKSCLEQAGCCPRCVLRHIGERAFGAYAEKELVLAAIEKKCSKVINTIESECNSNPLPASETSVSPTPKRKYPNPCPSCLGVLQSGCDVDAIQLVVDTIRSSSYQFQNFVLQLSMPPSVELREVLMKLYLVEEHSDIYLTHPELEVASVRDAWKWSVGPFISKTFKADFTPKSAFSVTVKMSHPDLETDCKPLQSFGVFPNINGKIKNLEDLYTRNAVLKAIKMKDKCLKDLYTLPPSATSSQVKVDNVLCSHQPIYLAGRYNKFSREMSQTPWLVDGEKRCKSSVEEEIVELVHKNIPVDKIVFSSSGREDVDVRMLGNGRPFVLELVNPKTVLLSKEFVGKLQQAINSSTQDVAVLDFQTVNKDELQNLKDGEEEKKKMYCALCCINRPLTNLDVETISKHPSFELVQKTPIRVLHRRTQAVRKRTIFGMQLDIKDDFTFLLHLETQAGTYVKEFVHGDFGRTKPCLGDILNANTDIIELDVEKVELDWPPPLS